MKSVCEKQFKSKQRPTKTVYCSTDTRTQSDDAIDIVDKNENDATNKITEN